MGNRATALRTRAIGFGSVLIVSICVVLAAPVFAFTTKVMSGVTIPKEAKGSATATCPSGEHVGFGGVVAEFQGPPNSGPIVFPEGMRRTATGKWSVYGQSGSTHVGSRLTAVAYCLPTTFAPSIVSTTVTVSGFHFGSATATCPTGKVLVAGGYNTGAAIDHIELVAQLERLSSTQWHVSVTNLDSGATKLTAYAYCGKGPAPQVASTTITLGGSHGGFARVHCPAGKTIVFGGLTETSPVDGVHGAAVAPFSWTAASNTEWDVYGYNAGDRNGTLQALIYCR
jgi:hypothetical protein